MSTEALRMLIDGVADKYGEGRVRQARKELEAIERAANRRGELAVAIADGDTAAWEELVDMAANERNAAIARQEDSK